MKVGVLALQGDFEAHQKALRAASNDVEAVQVRTREDLDSVDRLIIPGGESTTIGKLATQYDLIEPLRKRASDGMPIFGTCAGLIMCATHVTDGDQPLLGIIDMTVRRNAYGRQVDSFETDLEFKGFDDPIHAVFIRAPWVEEVGPEVEVLATHDDRVVAARHSHVLVAAFHPELTEDPRIHSMFLGLASP
ncbi:MAG: pyridoxal 5'-phosphate synthase glutaminase subunit PdxT [Actinomycetota bacterium]